MFFSPQLPRARALRVRHQVAFESYTEVRLVAVLLVRATCESLSLREAVPRERHPTRGTYPWPDFWFGTRLGHS